MGQLGRDDVEKGMKSWFCEITPLSNLEGPSDSLPHITASIFSICGKYYELSRLCLMSTRVAPKIGRKVWLNSYSFSGAARPRPTIKASTLWSRASATSSREPQLVKELATDAASARVVTVCKQEITDSVAAAR